MSMLSLRTWAIIVMSVTVVVGFTALYLQYYGTEDYTENNNGLNDRLLNERNLIVAEMLITYNQSIADGTFVIAHIGIENQGNVSQNLDGCKLRTELKCEGILMEDMLLDLDGTLGSKNITSHKFEFSESYSSGDEMAIHVTIWDVDGKVIDWNFHQFNIP